MSEDLHIENKINDLINVFNSKNYELVIKQAKELINSETNNPIIYNLLGASYSFINMHEDAIGAFQNAARLDTNNEEIYRNLGKSYSKLREDKKAYEYFEKATTIKPDNADAVFGIGLLKLKEKKFKASIDKFSLAIQYNKNFYQAYYNRAIAENFIGNISEAQNSYLEAIRINNNYYQAYNNLGAILIKIKKTPDAIKILENAIKIKPNYIEALTNLGVAYLDLKNYEKALQYFNEVLKIDSLYVKAISQRLYLMRKICDWSEDKLLEKNLKFINKSKTEITPWQMLSLDDDPEIEFIRAQKYGYQFGFEEFNSINNNPKIKLAYFTSDFYEHAGMINMEGIFKHHDRNKFEIYAFDYGNFYNDSTHKRVKEYFDKFYYIDKLSDEEVIKIIKESKIDIVVHRNGYSQNSRNSLFAKKMAPLQISFLGYPGTMGVKFIDYIIGDKTVIPERNLNFFSEKIIYMPDTYYPTFNNRSVSKKNYLKSDFGLDEDSFVFGCFNNSYKISSTEFRIWMELLDKVENSNLVLLINDELTKNNLIKEIIKHKQDPNKVKFLKFLSPEEHLARHKLIDLYLDTFNYNGHTSSIDALYTGVPVLTKIGNSFTSRVCASILKSIKMVSLIANNEKEYLDFALEIAKNKTTFNKIKLDLKNNFKTTALFDTEKYVKNLEKGFEIALNNKIKENIVDHIIL